LSAQSEQCGLWPSHWQNSQLGLPDAHTIDCPPGSWASSGSARSVVATYLGSAPLTRRASHNGDTVPPPYLGDRRRLRSPMSRRQDQRRRQSAAWKLVLQQRENGRQSGLQLAKLGMPLRHGPVLQVPYAVDASIKGLGVPPHDTVRGLIHAPRRLLWTWYSADIGRHAFITWPRVGDFGGPLRREVRRAWPIRMVKVVLGHPEVNDVG